MPATIAIAAMSASPHPIIDIPIDCSSYSVQFFGGGMIGEISQLSSLKPFEQSADKERADVIKIKSTFFIKNL